MRTCHQTLKTWRLIAVTLMLCLFGIDSVLAQVSVRGYYRKDGAYVRPHVRTYPDGNPYNNYSFPGNYNPNTGRITPGNPETYLRNYYNRNSSSGSSSGYSVRSRTRESVTAVQTSLKWLGYSLGTVDGIWGPRTSSALQSFQGDYGLERSGDLNSVTIDKLIEALSEIKTSEYGYSSTVSVPENASSNYWGTGWQCNRGFRQVGASCEPVRIPANASLDYWGHDWTCNRGYYRSGEECVRVRIPANASLDYWGTGWTCDRGYRRVGSGCEMVRVPANAHLDYWRSGWQCDRGYTRVGEGCRKVMVPANAHLDYWGTGWVCDQGYRRVGNECKR
jgi:hypothetical protein